MMRLPLPRPLNVPGKGKRGPEGCVDLAVCNYGFVGGRASLFWGTIEKTRIFLAITLRYMVFRIKSIFYVYM
jgi:hypothetical protein